MEKMEIDDSADDGTHNLLNQGNIHGRKWRHRCVSICLGLLCIVLLVGNIGQLVYYKITCPASTDAPQAAYNALSQNQNDILAAENRRLCSELDALSAEKQQFNAMLRNLTEHNEQLHQICTSLTIERDKLGFSINNVTNKINLLQANYSGLKTACGHVKTSYDELQQTFKDLQSDHNNLTADVSLLNTKYKNLQTEKEELQTRFSLEVKRVQSERNCSFLRKEKDQLQESLQMLNRSNIQIQTNYSLLWKNKELLKTKYAELTKEKEDLQMRCQHLINSTDILKTNDKIGEIPSELLCPTHWRYFETKCYFVSTVKKNWTESRRACISEGADLVIINNHEEQSFVHGMLHKDQNAWIGLTDSLTEGVWIWVDKTPVTKSYWLPGQPNNYRGQDCGEMVQTDSGGKWNDDGCFSQQLWICEK